MTCGFATKRPSSRDSTTWHYSLIHSESRHAVSRLCHGRRFAHVSTSARRHSRQRLLATIGAGTSSRRPAASGGREARRRNHRQLPNPEGRYAVRINPSRPERRAGGWKRPVLGGFRMPIRPGNGENENAQARAPARGRLAVPSRAGAYVQAPAPGDGCGGRSGAAQPPATARAGAARSAAGWSRTR